MIDWIFSHCYATLHACFRSVCLLVDPSVIKVFSKIFATILAFLERSIFGSITMDSPMAGATDKQSLFLELRIHNRGPRCVHKTKKGCMCERVNWLPYQKNVVKGKSSTKQVTQGCSDVEDWWLGVYKQNNPSH